MESSFESDLGEYIAASASNNSAQARTQPAIPCPEGFEVSADPQYAYNRNNGLWFDLYTGTTSYYDPNTCMYVPIQAQHMGELGSFGGVVRLVVVESSSALPPGYLVDIDLVEGLSIGRDQLDGTPHLRIPDINVSRYHARVYASDESIDDASAGSEDGEIEEAKNDTGTSASIAGGDLSDGECTSEHGETPSQPLETAYMPRIYIVDQGSTHGTLVNGARLSESKCASKPYRLQHMDRISVGDATLQLHIHDQWACAQCRSSSFNSMQADPVDKELSETKGQNTDRNAPSLSNSAAKHQRSDLQQERIDNLKAIRRKYEAPSKHTAKAKSNYTDRAKIRRTMQHPVVPLDVPPAAGTTGQAETTLSPEPTNSPIGSDNIGYSMLANIGWVPGTGLGRDKAGIVNPVNARGNDARAGLGAADIDKAESRDAKILRLTRERFDGYR